MIEKQIAQLVKEKGGRTFYVGGYVRDKLLNIENKDVDIEIHGINKEQLQDILKQVGDPISYGKSFGVYSLKGYDIDIALPRSEKAIGKGHKDFKIDVDPFIGYKQAARRRDITINALMQDVLTDEILDYYNGLDDLKNKIIRQVDSSTFIEDPLRVLRVAQFASRFEFEVAQETIELCKTIDLSFLSKERVEEELRKCLLKGKKPSIFFDTLNKMNQLDYWFKEIKDLISIKQDPIYHPEGDVYIHTMQVIDRAVKYRNKCKSYEFMLLCLTHDFGKIICSENINGRIHAYEHEVKGIPIIDNFIKRIANRKEVITYLKNMVPLHMLPNKCASDNSRIKKTNKMFYCAIEPTDLIYFSYCDKGDEDNSLYLNQRYEEYKSMIIKPYVTGNDLIKAGIKQDKNFHELIEYATKLRLAEVNKDDALKQVLAYYNKEFKKMNWIHLF